MTKAHNSGNAVILLSLLSATLAAVPTVFQHFLGLEDYLLKIALIAILAGMLGKSFLPLVRFAIAMVIYAACWIPVILFFAWLSHLHGDAPGYIFILATMALGIPYFLFSSLVSFAGCMMSPLEPSMIQTFRATATAQVCFQCVLWHFMGGLGF